MLRQMDGSSRHADPHAELPRRRHQRVASHHVDKVPDALAPAFVVLRAERQSHRRMVADGHIEVQWSELGRRRVEERHQYVFAICLCEQCAASQGARLSGTK